MKKDRIVIIVMNVAAIVPIKTSFRGFLFWLIMGSGQGPFSSATITMLVFLMSPLALIAWLIFMSQRLVIRGEAVYAFLFASLPLLAEAGVYYWWST